MVLSKWMWPALTFIIIYTTTFPDGYGHPCHDQVLQPARHVLRHLRLQQIPLWLQVPLVPSQHLLWPQEEPRLCVKGGRSEHFYTFFFSLTFLLVLYFVVIFPVSVSSACETVADTLFNTVWTLGCRPYMNSQRAACYCQGEEKDEL